MQLEINDQEREHLQEILSAVHAELLHELHHTDTLSYKQLLKDKVGRIESMQKRLRDLKP